MNVNARKPAAPTTANRNGVNDFQSQSLKCFFFVVTFCN